MSRCFGTARSLLCDSLASCFLGEPVPMTAAFGSTGGCSGKGQSGATRPFRAGTQGMKASSSGEPRGSHLPPGSRRQTGDIG